ncbi:MAG: hypothetical protein HDQ87_01130 [Clostridia bacterium]|nr:hypothetical protein [Clostridia bacterium]
MKESYDKMIANAELAKETVGSIQGELQHKEKLQTYFHLRPTTAGVVLVSTLPYAPMSGVVCSKDDLADKIKMVDSKMDQFISNSPDYPKLLEELKALGFGPEMSAGTPPLTAIQSTFITEMNERQDAYGALRFVASELVIPKEETTGGYHFDIVAFGNEALYFIELKKDRSETIFDEMGRCMTDLYEHQQDFLKKLMAAYPLTAPGTEGLEPSAFHRVQGLVAMPEAESITTDWQQKANDSNIELWFYQPALVYRKYLPMNRTDIL